MLIEQVLNTFETDAHKSLFLSSFIEPCQSSADGTRESVYRIPIDTRISSKNRLASIEVSLISNHRELNGLQKFAALRHLLVKVKLFTASLNAAGAHGFEFFRRKALDLIDV